MTFGRLYGKFGALSIENDEVVGDQETAQEEIAAAEAQAEAAEAQAEIAQDEAEVAAVEEAAEEAADVAIAVENLKLLVKNAGENGGLDANGAALLKFGMEQAVLRLQGNPADFTRAIPSMESFGGIGSRRDATALSMESVKEFGKRVWDGLLNMLKKIREKMKEYFFKVLGSAERLKKRALALQERKGKMNDVRKNKDQKTISDATLAGRLVTGGATDVAAVTQGMKAVQKLASAASGVGQPMNKKLETVIEKLDNLDTVNEGATEFNAINTTLKDAFKDSVNASLPGNQKLLDVEISEVVDPNKIVASYRLGADKKEVKPKEELAILDTATISSFAVIAEDVANKFIDSRKIIEEGEKIYTKLEKAVKSAASSADDDEAQAENRKAQINSIKASMTLVNKPIKEILVSLLGKADAALSWAEKSAAKY